MQETIVVHREKEALQHDFEQRLAYDREIFAEMMSSLNFSLDINPLSLPLSIWGNLTWEFMDAAERDKILSSFFRFTLRRGLKTMALYKNSHNYAAIKPEN